MTLRMLKETLYLHLSRKEKAELAIQSLMDSCTLMAESSGGTKNFPGYEACFAPNSFASHRVRLYGNAPAGLEQTIAEIASGAKEGTLPPRLSWLDCDWPDREIMPLLTAAGYVPLVTQKAMYISLSGYRAGTCPENIQPLSMEQAESWVSVTGQVFPVCEPDNARFIGHDACDYLGWWEDARLIGTTMLLCCGGNAGIHQVGTLPDHRGCGIAGALVRRALDIAAEKGCMCATLQASEMGYPVYTRLGMELVGNIHSWILKPVAA